MVGSTFLIIRGIAAILFGFLAFVWPGLTIAALVALFAVYAVIDGVTNLILGITDSPEHGGRSWALVLSGLAGIAAGGLTFMWPGITALALVFFMASWAIVTGAFEIAAAIHLRRVITGEWLMMLSGVLSIAFGITVFAFPAAGAIGIAWALGTYAAVTGIVLLVLGIRLRPHRVLIA